MARRITVLLATLATAAGLVTAGAVSAEAKSVPNLTLAINHTSFVATQTGLLRIHLGGPGGGKVVSIYRTLPSGTVQKYDHSVTTDAHGNASFKIPMVYNAYYTATWPGNASWLAAKRSTGTIKVVAYTQTHLAGQYGTSGQYHLFHANKSGELDVFVYPEKSGQKANFPLQSYYGGKWHTQVNNAYTLKKQTEGSVTYSITGTSFTGPKGYASRIRAEYHGDKYNLGKISGWYYVKFV